MQIHLHSGIWVARCMACYVAGHMCSVAVRICVVDCMCYLAVGFCIVDWMCCSTVGSCVVEGICCVVVGLYRRLAQSGAKNRHICLGVPLQS